MNKQTTALQKLIGIMGNVWPSLLHTYTYKIAKRLLEKEKEQIINAHIAGQKFSSDNDNPDSEEYFNQTYNQ